MKRLVALIPIGLVSLICCSQTTKQVTEVKQVWMGYINQTQFGDHLASWFAFHLRTKDDFTVGFSQFMLQGGLSYLAGRTRITAGYTFVNYFPGDNHPEVNQPEHRPWQLIAWNSTYKRLRTTQSFRLEERWRRKISGTGELAQGYHFNYRVGYNLQLNYPLSKKGLVPNSLSLVAHDDLQVNFGKEIVYNYFDQNRVFAGLNYMTPHGSHLQIGYLRGLQQLSKGSNYRKLQAIRIFYFHNLSVKTHGKLMDKHAPGHGH